MSSTPIAPFTSRRPISVSTRPGATTFTWMPLRRSSLASVHASASSAAFAMLYGAEFAAMCTRRRARDHHDVAARAASRIDGSTSFEHDHAPNACVRHDPLDLGRIGVGDGLAARRDARVVHEDVDRAEVGEHARRPSPRTAAKSSTDAAYATARRPSFSISATVSARRVVVARGS